MDDLRFIEMFGEIDEKIVQEANDDLNFWQEAREGVVVCVGNPRRSPLRIVFASVACAAVVFGAVFFMRNFLKGGFEYMPGDPSSSDQGGESSNREDTITINSEVIWGMGKTVNELMDRYGEYTENGSGAYQFKHGYGIYHYNRGRCVSLEVNASDLLTGDLSTVNLDNIVSKCGFDVIFFEPESDGPGLYDDSKVAHFSHPSYENITFLMTYKISGFDDEATFNIRYYDDAEYDKILKGLKNPPSRTECEQIVALFKSWGDLDYNIHPDLTDTSRDYFPECLDTSQFITEEITPKGSIRTYTEHFYLVASGDFSTKEGFDRKLDEMFSEKFKETYMGCSSWQMFRFKDGEVYVTGFKYYDEKEPQMLIYLNIESIDENTVVLNVINSADDDAQKNTATLVKTENGGFKIDEVGKYDSSLFDIPWLFHHKNIEVIVNWQGNTLYDIVNDSSDQSTDDYIKTLNSVIDTSTDVDALNSSIKGADGNDRVQKVQVFEHPNAFEQNVVYSAGELKDGAIVLVDFKDGTHYITSRGERTTEPVPMPMMFSHIIRRAGSVEQLKEEIDGYNRGLGDSALTKITIYQNGEDAKNGSNGVTIFENGKIVASDEDFKKGEVVRAEYYGGEAWIEFGLE